MPRCRSLPLEDGPTGGRRFARSPETGADCFERQARRACGHDSGARFDGERSIGGLVSPRTMWEGKMAYDAISKAIGAASHDPMDTDGIMAHLKQQVRDAFVHFVHRKDDLPRGFI